MMMLETYKKARRAGTPLIAIMTPDPAATINTLISNEAIIIQWDICNGWRACTAVAESFLRTLAQGNDVQAMTSNPAEMIILAAQLPEQSTLFVLNAQRYLTSDSSPATAGFIQGLWNLRDQFKANNSAVVLLAPELTLPIELQSDVLVIDEPLPDDAALQTIITTLHAANELPEPEPEILGRAVDALRGLAAFPAEQVTAMSLTRRGLLVTEMWERKRQLIDATPGLTVWRGGETFADIGGSDVIKDFLRRILAGAAAPRVIVFIDEIEKAMSGAQGDTSGVSQGFLGTLLTEMQDTKACGSIFIGPPGSGKSAIAKAAGAEGGIPTIALDLSGMKASLVGESEQRLRQALKVIRAVGSDRALWLATCNRISALPPELRRRFTLGTFFFDLPTEEERRAIWAIWKAAYSLGLDDSLIASFVPSDRAALNDDGWTGAEIRQCCDVAWRLKIKLSEAAQFVVPVARAAADEIEALRRQASGRFLSASYPGVFNYQPTAVSAPARGRQLNIE
jgi:hypothetical protein